MSLVFFGGSYLPTLCDLEMSSLNFVCVFFEKQIVDDFKHKVVSV